VNGDASELGRRLSCFLESDIPDADGSLCFGGLPEMSPGTFLNWSFVLHSLQSQYSTCALLYEMEDVGPISQHLINSLVMPSTLQRLIDLRGKIFLLLLTV
jgi:hypothetical protein